MPKYTRFLTLLFQFLSLALIAQTSRNEIENWNTKRPSRFIENKGQVTDQFGQPRNDVKYVYSAPGFKAIFKANSFSYEVYTKQAKPSHRHESVSRADANKIFLDTSGITYLTSRIDIDLSNALTSQIIPSGKSEDYYNYYLQHTGEDGIQNVYSYTQLTYKNVWPNIDLVFYARSEGELKYDIIVYSGGDIKNVKFSYSGVDKLSLKDGELQMATGTGVVNERIPISLLGTERVDVKYDLHANCIGFNGIPNTNQILVIDPVVSWTTYLGGNSEDVILDFRIDSTNNICGTGSTYSTSNIASSGSFQSTWGGNMDAFIVKFTSSGKLSWCTYYGGSSYDQFVTVDIDKYGNIYVGGEMPSTGMATSGAYKTTSTGGLSGFLAKFTLSGSRSWATYFGRIRNCVTDSLGDVYITGNTSNTSISTSNAYQKKNGGLNDAFLAKFNPSGKLSWSTYFGDAQTEMGLGVTLDKNNNVYMVGIADSTWSMSDNNGFQSNFGGGPNDGFLVKFDTSGKYKWFTYIGGTLDDNSQAVSTDQNGNVYVTGYTKSLNNIANKQAQQSVKGGNTDAYLMKFTASGSKAWGSYFGGAYDDEVLAISCDKYNNILICGSSYSASGIATSSAIQKNNAGNDDAYIARFTSSGRLSYGSYFGGNGGERSFNVEADTANQIFLAGFSGSSNMATSGVHQTTYGGGFYDGFVTGFRLVENVDASIARIILEDSFCTGTYPIGASLQNVGLAKLDSVKINWSINGTAQTSYMWKGSLKTDSLANVSLGKIKFDSGLYNIKVWTTKPNNMIDSFPDNDTVSEIFRVVFRSTPDFEFTNRCLDSSIVFTNKSAIATDIKSYLWDFGDSTTSTSKNPTKAYKEPGKYSVKLLEVNVNGCRDSVIKTVTTYPKPQIAFSAANSCLRDSIKFINTSSISPDTVIAYKWNFGDGTISTFVSPVKVYSKPGTYTVSLKAWSNHGCSDSISKSIVVYPRPTIKFSANNGCANDLLSFQNASSISGDTISSFLWKFGDGSTSSSVNPAHTYNTPGKYLITLIGITNHGCADSSSQTITIYELPKAGFTFISECSGENITFANTTTSADTIVSNTWSFGDGKTSTAANPTKKYFVPGTYDVKLVVQTVNGCIDSISKKVVIYPKPKAAFSIAGICLNDYAVPTNNSVIQGDTISQYLWDFGDGTTSTLMSPAHRYKAVGTYTVTLKVQSSKGCTDSSSNLVTIYPLPEAGFSFTNTCIPGTTQFSDSSKLATQWSWSFGDSANSSSQNPNHRFITSGKYKVTLIITSVRGCTDTITREVEIFDSPTASFSVNNTCISDSISPVNSSQHTTGYFWQFGDGSTSVMQHPAHKYQSPGTYTIKLLATNNGRCQDSTLKNVTIYPLPKLTIHDTISERNVKFLVSDSLYASYSWNFGDGNSSTDKNPFHRYPGIGSYVVDLSVADTNGCIQIFKDTVNIMTNNVHESESPGISVTVYPNPFNDQTRVEYTLTNASKVSLSLFDICGRSYQLGSARQQAVGQHVYILNGKETNLKSGLYLLEIKVDDVPFFIRILKL
jgi:PKD repeat protein